MFHIFIILIKGENIQTQYVCPIFSPFSMNEIDYLSFTRFGCADCTVIKYK